MHGAGAVAIAATCAGRTLVCRDDAALQRALCWHKLEQPGLSPFPTVAGDDRSARTPFSRPPFPVFPRYLFVALDLELQRWRRINGTFGIRYLVCQGNRPLATPNGVVEALLQSSNSEGRLIAAEDDLAPGKSVRVVTGSFAGLTGVVQRLDGAKRVKLLLEILGVARAASTLRKTVTPV